MGMSKRHLSSHTEPMSLDVEALGRALREACPDIVLAFLTGSAASGRVALGSDIDLAIYTEGHATLDLRGRIEDVVAALAPRVHCDIGFLSRAEPVYRFEALKGRLLFTRDMDRYVRFFSLTCREYEDQLFDYERQYRYRMETAA